MSMSCPRKRERLGRTTKPDSHPADASVGSAREGRWLRGGSAETRPRLHGCARQTSSIETRFAVIALPSPRSREMRLHRNGATRSHSDVVLELEVLPRLSRVWFEFCATVQLRCA